VSVLGAHDSSFFSRRTTVLFFIVCVHVAAIYGLASGFRQQASDKVSPPAIKAHVEDLPRILEVVLPPMIFTKPDVKVMDPPPLPKFELLPVIAPPATVTLGPTIPPSTGQSSDKAVTRVPGGPGKGFPSTREFYSSAAILAEESGVAAIRVCVDAAGRLTSDPIIATSSGYPRLDKDALALARAGSGHYRSTTENGAPISDCYAYRVRFELR
jgi:TonB family protein